MAVRVFFSKCGDFVQGVFSDRVVHDSSSFEGLAAGLVLLSLLRLSTTMKTQDEKVVKERTLKMKTEDVQVMQQFDHRMKQNRGGRVACQQVILFSRLIEAMYQDMVLRNRRRTRSRG